MMRKLQQHRISDETQIAVMVDPQCSGLQIST